MSMLIFHVHACFNYNSKYILSVQVHERQTARMRTRSEWFLTPVGERLAGTDSDPTALAVLRGSNRSSSGNIGEKYKRKTIYLK